MRLFYLFITSNLLFGCKSGVEFENIQGQDLVAVSSFISPQDTILTATVSKGYSLDGIFRTDSLLVKDAEVILSSEQKNVILKYNEKTKVYESLVKQIKIEQGKIYTLTVRTKQNKVITGQCTIPSNLKEGKVIGQRKNDDLAYFSEWERVSGYNYYLSKQLVKGTYLVNNKLATLTPQLNFTNESSIIEVKESEKIEISGGVSNWYKSNNANLLLTLAVLDDNTFKYLKSLENYNNFNANLSNTFPSFTEPQPIYSNMKGEGIGIFGGFQQTSVILK